MAKEVKFTVKLNINRIDIIYFKGKEVRKLAEDLGFA